MNSHTLVTRLPRANTLIASALTFITLKVTSASWISDSVVVAVMNSLIGSSVANAWLMARLDAS